MDIFRNARHNFLRRLATLDQADLERQQGEAVVATAGPSQRNHDTEWQHPRQNHPLPLEAVLHRFTDSQRPSIQAIPSISAFMNHARPTSSHYGDVNNPNDSDLSLSDSGPGHQWRSQERLGNEIASRKTPDIETTTLQAPVPPPNVAVTSELVTVGPEGPDEVHQEQGRQRWRRRHGRWRNSGAAAEAGPANALEEGRNRPHGRPPTRGEHGQGDGQRSFRRHSQVSHDGHDGRGAFAQGSQPPTYNHTPSTTTLPTKKRFLFCFPYVRSRRMRSYILRCTVAGLFLALLLAIYVALTVTHNMATSEFSVLLILIMALALGILVHCLIRIWLMVVRPPSPEEEAAAEERYRMRHGRGGGRPLGMRGVYGNAYAIPRQPIRVLLARDEEAAGLESVAAKTQPPAYGLWRESVRVDPNRIYWQRNNAVPLHPQGETGNDITTASEAARSSQSSDVGRSSSRTNRSSTASGTRSPRPPSYASDDGVRYVVEAQPRSIAPTWASTVAA